jgi:hypothetical protein
MLSLPIAFSSAIGVFASVFSRSVWQNVKGLLTGAVLAPGKRTVTAILQSMGRSAEPDFQTYNVTGAKFATIEIFGITGCKFQVPQNARKLISVYAINFMP